MSFFKRAIYATTRRLSKTIIMLIILLAIANLIITGISIQNATDTAKVLARQKLGAEITLSFDSSKAMKQSVDEMKNSDSSSKKAINNITYEPITDEMITQVTANEHVVDYNLIVNTNAYASDFETVTDETEQNIKNSEDETKQQIEDAKQSAESAKEQVKSFNNSNSSGTGSGRENGGQGAGMPTLNLDFNVNINMANVVSPDLTVIGVSNYELEENFTSNNYTIVDGEGIYGTSEIQNKVLIEESLATANDLSVGDAIKVKVTSEGTELELTIVGIYKAENVTNSGMSGMSVSLDYNKIFVDYKTALNIKETGTSEKETSDTKTMYRGVQNSSTGIDSVVFEVDDPANVDEVLEYASTNTNIDLEKFKLDANTEEYEEMIKPLENVASFSKLLIIIVAIAGALIIMLVMMLWIKERTYETGVLLSLGESKIKIMLQYVTEILIIAVIAFTISIFTGNIISQKVGNELLAKEITATQTETTQSSSEQKNIRPDDRNVSDEVEVVSQIDVSVNTNVILQLYGIGIAIVIVSSILPNIIILRYKPKKILTNA